MKAGEEQAPQPSGTDRQTPESTSEATISAAPLAPPAGAAVLQPPAAEPDPKALTDWLAARNSVHRLLELVQWILDDSSRTCRALLLLVGLSVPLASLAGVFYVIELNADLWMRVLFFGPFILLSTSAITMMALGRIRGRGIGRRRVATPLDAALRLNQDRAGDAKRDD